MRDFHLILFVLALVLIDVIFITIWVYYDPLETKEIIFDKLVSLGTYQMCIHLRLSVLPSLEEHEMLEDYD